MEHEITKRVELTSVVIQLSPEEARDLHDILVLAQKKKLFGWGTCTVNDLMEALREALSVK